MIGIVVALYNEIKGSIETISAKEKNCKAGKRIFTGKIHGKEVVFILSGVGKVNAALSTQFLIDNYPIDYIINFGSVGGISGQVKIADYYIIDKCCQYDFDTSAIDNVPIGYIQDYDTVYFYPKTDKIDFLPKISLASSDRFTEKETDVNTIRNLACAVFDMEGGAIAQVCKANDVPLYIFKGVTDLHGSGNDVNTFYKNLNSVCSGFFEILEKTLAAL